MSQIKQLSFIIVLLFSLMHCNNSDNFYTTPINNWMEGNLNDISSYEPVEYRVIDNRDYVLTSGIQIGYYSNVLMYSFSKK